MIDRRTFLRSTAGAATLGGIAIMATPSAAATVETEAVTEIKRLIEAHRVAEATYGDWLNSYMAQEEPEAAGIEEKTAEIGDAALDALGELLDYPMTTFEEVMLKIAYFRQIPHLFFMLSCFEDPEGALFDAFPPTVEEAGAFTAVSLGAGVTVAASDPFLAFLTEWEGMERAGDSIPDEDHDAWSDRHLVPLDQRVADGDIPNPTTADGAAAALRKAIDFGLQPSSRSLVRSALAFLEGRA